jgi:WD40 repeat protein
MANLASTVVKGPAPEDYCVGLGKTDSLLVSCFNSSNTICVHSLGNLAESRVYLTGSSSVLAEISVFDQNSVFWSDRAGNVGLVDFRTAGQTLAFSIGTEIFSVDSAGVHLAVATDKDLRVFDVRTYQEIRKYDQLFADDNDVTSVKIHPDFPNFILSGSEDSNFALCDINNVDDDDFTLLNIDEPVLKVGFTGTEAFAIGMNRLLSYDLNFLVPDSPVQLKRKFELSDLMSTNPEISFFVEEFGNVDRTFLAGGLE